MNSLAPSLLVVLLLASTSVVAFQPFSSQVHEYEVSTTTSSILQQHSSSSTSASSSGSSNGVFNPYNDTSFARNLKRNVERAPGQEERDEEARRRRARVRERRAKAQATLAKMSASADSSSSTTTTSTTSENNHHNDNNNHHRRTTTSNKKPQGVQRLTKEQIEDVQRRTSWFGSSSSYSYNAALEYLADPSADYDKWSQAYRMLGAFIDCDHDKSEGSGDQENNNDNNNGDSSSACSRWMMWAAYVNPNYQGYEYDEYFSDEPYSDLDCHNPDTERQLLGVYRQEFYQYIEQISKHLWAIDDYEYIVARAGLMYMTDYDCFQVGQDSSGNSIRAGIAPQPNGGYQMALYTDEFCLTPDTSVGVYDDYVSQTDVDLGSSDNGNYNTDDLYDTWYDTQEYTLTNLNAVYEEFMYCTPCMDYPTYQDGYFIGDYGTDDDDIINQCWKFHSHDSFICEAECIAMGHAQGSINQVIFGDKVFGSQLQASAYSDSSSSGSRADVLVESSWSRIMANAFLTFSFLLFVATFLAFAVARRSRYRESRSSKSRRLLDDGHHMDDDHNGGHRSVRSRRSRSRKGGKSKSTRGGSASRRSSSRRASSKSAAEEGDGLFRTDDAAAAADVDERRSRSGHRSKSRGGGSKRGRSKSGSKSKRSSSRAASRSKDPPSRKHAVHEDNF